MLWIDVTFAAVFQPFKLIAKYKLRKVIIACTTINIYIIIIGAIFAIFIIFFFFITIMILYMFVNLLNTLVLYKWPLLIYYNTNLTDNKKVIISTIVS